MSDWVVDARIVIKWFVPEVLSVEARRWHTIHGLLHAPALLDPELANILWKKIGRAELKRTQAERILTRLVRLQVTRHADVPVLPSALDVACQAQRTVRDSLYLALVLQLSGQMVTADRRLFNAIQATRWAASIRWVADVP